MCNISLAYAFQATVKNGTQTAATIIVIYRLACFTNFFITKRELTSIITAQKIKFSIKDFFTLCEQICSKMRFWSDLLKKSLMDLRKTSFFVQFIIILVLLFPSDYICINSRKDISNLNKFFMT